MPSAFCLMPWFYKSVSNNIKSTIRNILGDIRNTNHIRCDNCRFSTWLIGLGRHILMCRRKVNFIGKWSELRLSASCANFGPSELFLSSRRSFNKDGKAAPAPPRRIPLTKGKFALVDAEDYYRLSQFQWFININSNTIYAVRKVRGISLMMHRDIMAAPDHLFVDHIDHNGLNNIRSNLRLCSQAQNNCNKISTKGATSKYKGVSWNTAKKKWFAAIQHNGKKYRLGFFTDEIAAAIAYDKKASQLHHKFACLNFPPKF